MNKKELREYYQRIIDTSFETRIDEKTGKKYRVRVSPWGYGENGGHDGYD